MSEKSRVKDGNYVVLQSFMIKDLSLKGLELIVYAIIYGFSQNEGRFTGSLQYMADWTNSTKQGVIKCLKSLEEKGLITKFETPKNGVKFCEYYATELNTILNKVDHPIKQSLIPPIKHSLPNNIDLNNIEDNKDHNIVLDQKKSFKKWDLKDFENSIKEALIEFEMPKSEVLSFYEYWKEKTPDCKFRFQLQKTWQTDLRLKTWVRNENKWNPQKGKDQNKDQMKDAFMGYMEGVMSGKY